MSICWNSIVVGLGVAGLCAGSALAAPAVTAVSGSVTAHSQITITGTGFGTGPNVLFFDDFEEGADGQTVPIGNNTLAKIGRYVSAGTSTPKFSSVRSLGGALSFRSDRTDGVYDRLEIGLGANGTFGGVGPMKVFSAAWVFVPDGSTEAEGGPPGNYKPFWVWSLDGNDSRYVFQAPDFAAGLHTDTPYSRGANWNFGIRGHVTANNESYYPGMHWRAGKWQRILTYVDATPGLFEIQYIDQKNQTIQTKSRTYPTVNRPDASTGYRKFNLHGYQDERTTFGFPSKYVYYDDVYIADSRARVEIGDAANYADCSKLTLVTTGKPGDSWSDTSITATLRPGPFGTTDLDGAYVYVTNAAGEVNTAGYQIFTDVTETITLDVIGDSRILEQYKNTTGGTQQYLYATTAANSGKSCRPLLQFDISEVREQVDAASLWVYCAGSNAEVFAFPMISPDWDEDGVTWNHFDSPLSLLWITTGGDFEPTLYSSALTGMGPSFNGWVEIDVTDLVQAMVDDGQDIGAFLMLSDKTGAGTSGGDGTYVSIRSKEFGNGSLKAQLVVESTGP